MAYTDKDIVIVPNKGNVNADPFIIFTGANANNATAMTVVVYPDANGTLSVEASAGQLFSITNDLDTDLFVVNNKYAQSLITANADGSLYFNHPVSGNSSFGTGGKNYNLEVKDVIAVTRTTVPGISNIVSKIHFDAPYRAGNTLAAATIEVTAPGGWSNNATHYYAESKLTIKTSKNGLIESPYWINEFGDFGIDANTEYGSGVGFDSTGNMYVIGGFSNLNSNTWPVVAKFSANGSIVWQKYLDKTDYPGSYSYGEGFSVSPTGNNYFTIPYYNTNNYGIGKIDTDGNLVWQNEIITDISHPRAINITIDSNENVYSLGYLQSTANLVVTKHDAAGTLLWISAYQGTNGTDGDIVADSTGNVAFTYRSFTGSGAGVVKINGADGSIIWANASAELYSAYSITVDASDNFYIAGEDSAFGYAFVAKVAANGNFNWVTQEIDNNIYWYQTIKAADDGYLYAVGQGYDFVSGISDDLIISKFDLNGNVIWHRHFGSVDQDDYQWYHLGNKTISVKNGAYGIVGYSYPVISNQYNFTILRAPTDGTATGKYDNNYFNYDNYYPNVTSFISNTAIDTTITYISTPNYATANATPTGLVAFDNNFTPYLVPLKNSNQVDALTLDANGDVQLYGTIIDSTGSYGSANQVLTKVGSKTLWANSTGGNGGIATVSLGNTVNGQILFNSNGSIGGSNALTYNTSTQTISTQNLTVTGTTTLINANTITVSNLNIIGTVSYVSANAIIINSTEINSISVLTTTTSDQIIDTFANTYIRSTEYSITMNVNTDFQMTKISVLHDDLTAFMTEYGTILTSANNLGTFSTNYVSGIIRLNVVPTFANTRFKIARTSTLI